MEDEVKPVEETVPVEAQEEVAEESAAPAEEAA